MSAPPITVLVVDDDFRVAALHVAFVDRIDGFHVVGVAHTGAEALELAEALCPDLVLMDIYLPDVDGIRTLQQMLTQPSPPAAIVISAANDVANIRSALRLGVAHYLVKPFSFAAFSERMTAFRDTADRIARLPDEATQQDINRVFDGLRPTHEFGGSPHLAPTLQTVYNMLTASEIGLSASDISRSIGISRATAQRALTQLEQSEQIHLDLRYGRTGRPEHRYTIRQQS